VRYHRREGTFKTRFRKGPAANARKTRRAMHKDQVAPETLLCTLPNDQDSLSFLSSDFPAAAGVAFDISGEFDAEGGEAGCSASPDP